MSCDCVSVSVSLRISTSSLSSVLFFFSHSSIDSTLSHPFAATPSPFFRHIFLFAFSLPSLSLSFSLLSLLSLFLRRPLFAYILYFCTIIFTIFGLTFWPSHPRHLSRHRSAHTTAFSLARFHYINPNYLDRSSFQSLTWPPTKHSTKTHQKRTKKRSSTRETPIVKGYNANPLPSATH